MKTALRILIFLSVIAINILGLVATVHFTGVMDKKIPKFHPGDLVATILDGRKGMVIETLCDHDKCIYYVRFREFELKTDTHLLDDDGPVQISPYTLLYMKEFEIR